MQESTQYTSRYIWLPRAWRGFRCSRFYTLFGALACYVGLAWMVTLQGRKGRGGGVNGSECWRPLRSVAHPSMRTSASAARSVPSVFLLSVGLDRAAAATPLALVTAVRPGEGGSGRAAGWGGGVGRAAGQGRWAALPGAPCALGRRVRVFAPCFWDTVPYCCQVGDASELSSAGEVRRRPQTYRRSERTRGGGA